MLSAAMASIRQNAYPDVLPDFRNLGVIARISIAVNLVAFVAEFYVARGWTSAVEQYLSATVLLAPILIGCLVVLYAIGPLLQRLPYPAGAFAVVAGVAGIAGAVYATWPTDGLRDALRPGAAMARVVLLAALLAALLLAYLRLLARAYSPALAEARLQALQARIRPHFLFNSLNAVLSLIRREPQRAERALENLADLFRPLMSDGREFVPLADELSLLERYAELEHLRLGDRLNIAWDIDAAPGDAMLPPLVLQPLLENAVYHGVEPGTGRGDVLVAIARRGDRIRIQIENPYLPEQQQRAGNRMALDNLRERLQLFFDAEAKLETKIEGDRYRIELELPYRTRGPGAAP